MPNNEYLVTSAELTATADSIREKLGSQAAIRWDSGTGFKSSVDDIQTGGGGSNDDVRFLDYDGTIVQTYSAADFANLSELPTNPTHAGLTSQGWNWTLADAKTYVASYGKLDIGQTYVTDDGKTRIHIRLEEGRLDPYLGLAINGSADIDWGDGTAHSTLTGSSTITATYVGHSYASAGEYTIAVDITSGTAVIIGDGYGGNESTTLIRKQPSQPPVYNRVYVNSIIRVNIGLNIVLSEKCFANCNNLTCITIPLSVTSIGKNPFMYCYLLTSITIPSNTTSVGENTFHYCNSLVSASYPKDTSMTNNSFYGCSSLARFAISPSSTYLSNTFYNCYNLTSVVIPSSVTTIVGTFYSCYRLTDITIPSSVTTIGSNTFSGCHSLTSITIPSNVTIIDNNAFYNCYSLTSITIPSSVTKIGASAFIYCSAISSVIIPNSVTSIGNSAFSNCTNLTSITIPSSVTSIGSSVFNSCHNLSNVIIQSSSITTLPGFGNCYLLSNITIPSGVTTVSDFGQCVSLTSIVIPSNVTSIASSTFSGCAGLSFCKILKDTPPTCSGTSAWSNIPSDFQIIYPYASTIAYKSATNYPNISTYLYLGFYSGTDGEILPTTVTDGTTTYNLTWYANTKDAVAETNPITVMQGTEVYCRSVLAE